MQSTPANKRSQTWSPNVSHCTWCQVATEFSAGQSSAEERLLDLLVGAAHRSPRLHSAHEHTVFEVAHDALLSIERAWTRYDPGKCFQPWARSILRTEIAHAGRSIQSERVRRQCDLYRAALLRDLANAACGQHLLRLETLRAGYTSWESLYRDDGAATGGEPPLAGALRRVCEDFALSADTRRLACRLADETSAFRLRIGSCDGLDGDRPAQKVARVSTDRQLATDYSSAPNDALQIREEVLAILTERLDSLSGPAQLLARRVLEQTSDSEQLEERVRALADYLEEHPMALKAVRDSLVA